MVPLTISYVSSLKYLFFTNAIIQRVISLKPDPERLKPLSNYSMSSNNKQPRHQMGSFLVRRVKNSKENAPRVDDNRQV